ncbi:hypothetical protein G4B88_016301, partial [Cannabis sativa]
RIDEALNTKNSQKLEIDLLDLTQKEATTLETLGLISSMYGVFALLDHQTAALSTIADAVAAISCTAKEIVESNETRRLPKLPKLTKPQMAIRKRAFSMIEDVFERHGATALDTLIKLNHLKLLDGMLRLLQFLVFLARIIL